MVALYRPGPMELIPLFLEGKKNLKNIKYLHKDLIPILSETYGVLVYQEQVMEIAHKIAGYSMSEADILRMAMGKKKKSLMKKEEEKFISGCMKKGYSRKLAEKIFGFVEKFAGYGFNKPHSASYALIAYWTAYMKANYPVEYMTALLSAEIEGASGPAREAKVFQTIEECKAMKIAVLLPDINKSETDFKIEGSSIRFGLSAIKNVGTAAIESILLPRNRQNFSSFKDFLFKVDLRKVNKKVVESLIKAGALDQFGSRASLFLYYSTALNEVNKIKDEVSHGQFGLFVSFSPKENLKDKLPKTEDFSDEEKMRIERETIGFSISKNPLDRFREVINQKITKKIGEIDEEDLGKQQVIAGTINRIKKIITRKNNSEMAFVSLFDDSGSIEVIVFPKIFANSRDIWAPNRVVLLKGKVNSKDRRLNIIVDKAIDLSNYHP
jgi:DNA polymerase-3 subunit alpha